MKNLLTIILILFFSFAFGQKEGTYKLIDKKIYTVIYSEFFRSPITVTYKLYKPVHAAERTGMNFVAEKGLITATNKDFESNPYDKGHLAPAEDFADSEEHMKATFTYANCAVQHNKLNRGLWKVLEMKEREYAQSDSVKVINEVLFKIPYKKLSTGTYIPSGFRKTIIFLSTQKKLVYEFPNSETTHSIFDYEVK